MKQSRENPNIALVHEWLTVVAGGEKVLKALAEIYPKAPIYTSVYDERKVTGFEKSTIIPSFLQNIPLLKSHREFLVPFVPFAFEQFDLSKYDVVISSTTVGAKGVLTKPGTIHICYCHTPTRYIWEPHVDPRASQGKFGWLRRKVSHKLRIWDRVAADRVDFFLANSRYVANRIKKYYKRDAMVVYPPVDVELFKPVPASQIGDYFLFVSRLVDYKRCDIVVEAFNQTGHKLKIIGGGPEEQKLKSIAKSNIEFLGPKYGEDLRDYFARAKAFVFVAEEDFGIVPVEAMACGRPVIAYCQGGVKESVIPGITGMIFQEQTPESLALAIKHFEVADYDPIQIRQQAEKFSTERFKAEIVKIVDQIWREKGPR